MSGADICNCRYCNSGGDEEVLERRVEELEEGLQEAQRVIFSDNPRDEDYWEAVERAREIQQTLDRLESSEQRGVSGGN